MTVNPHAPHPASFLALTDSLWKNRRLIAQMTQREVTGRYKGSIIGLAWSLINPILMLAVYTFVFSVVFKPRWGTAGVPEDEARGQFAVILFVGLIIHGLFAEVVNRAPGLIVTNPNYVKKVVFPLEVLPVIALGAAVFHASVSLGVLLAAFAAFHGYLQWTVVFAPLVLLPLVVLVLGVAWTLASLGTYLRDIGQTVGILTSIMMFLSPVFYPVTALPASLQPLFLANPLTFIIEQTRDVLIWGRAPYWPGVAAYALVSLVVASVGFAWFQRTRKGFADVL